MKLIFERKWSNRLCNVVETIIELTYLGDRVSAGRRCEPAMTARTRI